MMLDSSTERVPKVSASEKDLMTLWGELFVILNSEHADALLAKWGQNAADTAAISLGDVSLEVATSLIPFVHEISHSASRVGPPTHLLSLNVARSSRGMRVADLLGTLLSRAADRGMVYDAMARRGLDVEPLGALDRQLTLATAPALFEARDVPQIRRCDRGVSRVSFMLSLDPAKALWGDRLTKAADGFGLSRAL